MEIIKQERNGRLSNCLIINAELKLQWQPYVVNRNRLDGSNNLFFGRNKMKIGKQETGYNASSRFKNFSFFLRDTSTVEPSLIVIVPPSPLE